MKELCWAAWTIGIHLTHAVSTSDAFIRQKINT